MVLTTELNPPASHPGIRFRQVVAFREALRRITTRLSMLAVSRH